MSLLHLLYMSASNKDIEQSRGDKTDVAAEPENRAHAD